MVSRLLSFVWPVALAASLLGFSGCAGSKVRSSSQDSGSSAVSEATGNAEQAISQRLEDARRSAEEAELKAHQLRVQKSKR